MKIALRDWHNAITKIYEVADDFDLSTLRSIDDSIHNDEIEWDEGSNLYDDIDWESMENTWENIHFINKSEIEESFDGLFWF